MSHCFLKTLGLEKHITLIFFCFSQRLRFSFSSEKNISPKQRLFAKPWKIFTFFLITAWELENFWRTDKGYRACSLFLGKRSCFSLKSYIVGGNINLPPKEPKSYLDSSGKPLSWLCLSGILWLVQVILSPRGRLMSSSKWVEYVMPFHSKKLNPHILQKQEVVFWGC